MNTAVEVDSSGVADIEFQDASLDIWDTKYRLKTKSGASVDHDIQSTYERVARSLASVEAPHDREHWYERFVWALQRGAIPAGRIISNAGAELHKPATSSASARML